MSFLVTGNVNYNSRITRAELLASRYTFAREVLEFYGRVARFQQEFHEQLSKLFGKRPRLPAGGNLRSQLSLQILAEPFQRFISLIESHGPGPLAAQARALAHGSEGKRTNLLQEFWQDGMLQASENEASDPLEEFLPRAFLLPYAEFLVSGILPPVLPMTTCRCPRCNSLPLLGVLRPEGDGGRRHLHCSFCSHEWEFRRIFCAQCGEEAEQKLPVYIAEQFPHLRVECCETCKGFLRTIDMTKDGNAVPLVDDLAAVPLTLWADENGYKRIQTNLFST
jgi:FdhE protein